MHRIIDFSLNNRFLILVFVLLLIGVGVNALLNLPIDAVPDVTPNQVQILTNAPGLSPLEVEQFITFPVETAMSGLPGIETIRSVSRFGLSAVSIYFEEDMDVYFCRRLVMERLPQAREAILPGFGTPEMGPISTGLGEIYQFEVKGEGYSLMELRSILDWDIAFKLRPVPGVVEVNSWGGELKTYEVQIDPNKLLGYNIPMARVFEALESNNANAGGAYIIKNQEQYLIRGEGLVQTIEQIGNIVLTAGEDGTPIYVNNVAQVQLAPMVRQGAVTRDGQGEAVTGVVMMLIGENSRVVVDRVKARIEEIRESLPPGVIIDTYYDRTDLVRETINTVITNLSEGGALVILVLLLLLGSFRGGLIVASAIPLSMLFAFIGMRQFGLSGNLMSLGAIDFGLIVDGSVVMIENIVRHLSHRSESVGEKLRVIRQGQPGSGSAHCLCRGHHYYRLSAHFDSPRRGGENVPAHGPDRGFCPDRISDSGSDTHADLGFAGVPRKALKERDLVDPPGQADLRSRPSAGHPLSQSHGGHFVAHLCLQPGPDSLFGS